MTATQSSVSLDVEPRPTASRQNGPVTATVNVARHARPAGSPCVGRLWSENRVGVRDEVQAPGMISLTSPQGHKSGKEGLEVDWMTPYATPRFTCGGYLHVDARFG